MFEQSSLLNFAASTCTYTLYIYSENWEIILIVFLGVHRTQLLNQLLNYQDGII